MTGTSSNNSPAIGNTQKVLKRVVSYAIGGFKNKGHCANIVDESVSLVELLTPLASLNDDDCVTTLSKTPKLAELLANVLSSDSPSTSAIVLPKERSSFLEKALAARCCARLFASETGRGVIENDQNIATG